MELEFKQLDLKETPGESSISLDKLPSELLINIFSHLDERDLYTVQNVSPSFNRIVNDEELWKNLFVSRYKTSNFPSFCQSDKFSLEFLSRKDGLHQWKHNKAIKTKYTISSGSRVTSPIEKLLFDFPRCLCYGDGVITILQLQNLKKNRGNKSRLTYIPCTTPQGCSTMHFDLNSAVFGRFDGRIFGKQLNSKSYLQPMSEFSGQHSTAVTAITSGSSDNVCVSGSENGEVMWWKDEKQDKLWKLSNRTILKVTYQKDYTVVLDDQNIYVIHSMKELHTLPLPRTKKEGHSNIPMSIHFCEIDFGSKSLIIADTKSVHIISFDSCSNLFGTVKTFELEDDHIEEIVMDEETSKKEQNLQYAGQDGCFVAIKTHSNQVLVANIRSLGPKIIIQTKLQFPIDEKVSTCQITNLVLVCALNKSINIYDALSGTLEKTIQKSEPNPGFMRISQGRLILTNNENTIHYYKFLSDDSKDPSKTGKGNGGAYNRNNNQWKQLMAAGMSMYDEEEESLERQRSENQRLLLNYGGSYENEPDEDEDIQLQIAMMESERVSTAPHEALTEDENLQRAIEESERMAQENEQFYENIIPNSDNDQIVAVEVFEVEQNRIRLLLDSDDFYPGLSGDERYVLALSLVESENH